jgi:DNA-binding PadR family transcriptional regulator
MVLLRDGPKSGSELSDLIEEYTEWRPSPGSMYPLLNRLQKNELITPYEDEDSNLKRFKLTEKGKEELGDHPNHEEEFRKRNRTVLKLYLRLMKGMPADVYDAVESLIEEIDDTWNSIDESEKIELFMDILDNAKADLMKLGKRQDE